MLSKHPWLYPQVGAVIMRTFGIEQPEGECAALTLEEETWGSMTRQRRTC